jgi:hypothetical protein
VLHSVEVPYQKSDRVLRLTATCIRSVVRVRYGYDISMASAIELARVHDVPSAVRVIGEKLELHQGRSQAARFDIAATEAAFTVGTKEDVDRTVSVRRASIDAASEQKQAGMPREVLVTRLRVLRRECEQWAREYSRFMDSIATLYAKADRDLKALRLQPEASKMAAVELESILLTALGKARDLELHVQAVA